MTAPQKKLTAADLYRQSREMAAQGDTEGARALFDQADKLTAKQASMKAARDARKGVGGRPPLPADQRTESRSIRLNDARWRKLQALGMEWLSRQIDRAPDPRQD